MDAGRQIVLLFLVQVNLICLTCHWLQKAVVSLLTAQLAIIKAVELGAWGRVEGEYDGDCVCVHGAHVHQCAGWKDGRGCESRGAALGKVVNCLLTASSRHGVWPLSQSGRAQACCIITPSPAISTPNPQATPAILLCPFLPSAAPLCPRSFSPQVSLLEFRAGEIKLRGGRETKLRGGGETADQSKVSCSPRQGAFVSCRSLGHHCSLSQLEAVTLY